MAALLFSSIILAVLNNIILHKYGNERINGTAASLVFNGFISCVWVVVFAGKNIYSNSIFTTLDVMWGLLYGATISFFLFSKMQALSTGPISITSFIGCSSLIVSTTVGIIFWNEKITIKQAIGVFLLLAALAVTISPKCEKTQKSWKYWCLLFFVCSGLTGVIFKLHQSSASKASIDQMMLIASISSAVILIALSFLISKKNKTVLPCISTSIFKYVILCGIVSCGYNRLNIFLSGVLPSIVFFPVFNGAVIILASLSGFALFREKLKTSQMIGIAAGMFALLLVAGVI